MDGEVVVEWYLREGCVEIEMESPASGGGRRAVGARGQPAPCPSPITPLTGVLGKFGGKYYIWSQAPGSSM